MNQPRDIDTLMAERARGRDVAQRRAPWNFDPSKWTQKDVLCLSTVAVLLLLLAFFYWSGLAGDLSGQRELDRARRDDRLMRETSEDRYFRKLGEAVRRAND